MEYKTDLTKTNHEIAMRKLHVDLAEVTVSAPFGNLQAEPVVNVTSADLSKLNTISGNTVGQAIENMVGVNNASLGVGISKPVIRGLSGNRVVTYIDGLRLENQQWGSDHGMGISELGIGRIEVIKGPSSLLYGPDAMGGVIYFVGQGHLKSDGSEWLYNTRFESASLGTTKRTGL